MKIWFFQTPQGKLTMRGVADDGSHLWIRGEIGPADQYLGLPYEQLLNIRWIETDDAGKVVRTEPLKPEAV